MEKYLPNGDFASFWGGGFLRVDKVENCLEDLIPGLVYKWLESAPLISHEKTIWKGNNTTLLRGQQRTTVPNQLQVLG